MPVTLITQTFLNNIKKEAKVLSRLSSIKHAEAREIIVRRNGFDSSKHLKKESELQQLIIQKDFRAIVNRLHKKDNQIFYSKEHSNFDNIPFDVDILEESIDVLEHGFDGKYHEKHQDPALHRLNCKIFAFGMNKEILKAYGHDLQNNSHSSEVFIGYILVAMGHFFSSVSYTFNKQRIMHCNFETYMSEWIERNVRDKEHVQFLRLAFPESDSPKMLTGGGIWGGYYGKPLRIEDIMKDRRNNLLKIIRQQEADLAAEEAELKDKPKNNPDLPLLW